MPKQHKHKAPIEVAVFRQEKSILQQWVDKYWKLAAVVASLLTAAVLYVQHRAQLNEAQRGVDWDVLNAALRADDDAALDAALKTLEGKREEPWGLLAKAERAIVESEPDEALAVLERLNGLGQNQAAILSAIALPIGPDGEPEVLTQYMQRLVAAQKAWDEEHKVLENPLPAEGSPRVILETDKGEIEVTLYLEKAPLHAKNFIKRCQAGEYDGTKFHKIEAHPYLGYTITGGDPETRNADRVTWGTGGKDAPKIALEKNGLVMAEGYLAGHVENAGSKESHGTMFVLTFGASHQLDANSTVFGKITGGMDVVEEIGESELIPPEPQDFASRGRPEEPVSVLSTKVLGL
jgi:cyclophilin family peptidyl-prolyl cis-trans isomerase